MHRYIAFIWNHRVAEREALAESLVQRLKEALPKWTCALDTKGLCVYHVGERPRSSQSYRLDRDAGIVLGRLFKRCADPKYESHEFTLNERETKRIGESDGRHLIEHYWGRYVAILRSMDGAHVRILRDPTGAIPCLSTNYQGVDVVFSHIDDCVALGLVRNTINWDHIAAYLQFPRLVTKDTGLCSVRQVLAGECVDIGINGTTTTFYWSPGRIHDAQVVEDRQQAMQELGDAIQYCVEAWASCYNEVLLSLSGGLDSAVVLACLSKRAVKANVICENYYTEGISGDERLFARKAADLSKVELIELPFRASDQSLDSMFDATKLARPAETQLTPELERHREELVKERNVEAVFSGQGGDHLFEQTATSLIAADYAWRHGLRPEILGVIADTSRFTRKPIWSVMATVFNAGIFHRQNDPYVKRLKPPLLLSEATSDALKPSDFRHPWVDDAAHLPPNKINQIANIIDSQNFYQRRCHYASTVHPLISQPIIELCLQIPSYTLTYGGRDRALVRDAFSGKIPPEITRRTTKGVTVSTFNQLLIGNLPFLREFLLDGLLVRESVLDRRKTEANLTESEIVGNPFLFFPMVHAIFAEAWLRNWRSETPSATA